MTLGVFSFQFGFHTIPKEQEHKEQDKVDGATVSQRQCVGKTQWCRWRLRSEVRARRQPQVNCLIVETSINQRKMRVSIKQKAASTTKRNGCLGWALLGTRCFAAACANANRLIDGGK